MSDVSITTDFYKDSLPDDDSATKVSDQVVPLCFSESSTMTLSLHLYNRGGSYKLVLVLKSKIKEYEMEAKRSRKLNASGGSESYTGLRLCANDFSHFIFLICSMCIELGSDLKDIFDSRIL